MNGTKESPAAGTTGQHTETLNTENDNTAPDNREFVNTFFNGGLLVDSLPVVCGFAGNPRDSKDARWKVTPVKARNRPGALRNGEWNNYLGVSAFYREKDPPAGEQARVREVQNPALAIIERTKKKLPSDWQERDVAGRNPLFRVLPVSVHEMGQPGGLCS